ncbi:MAG: YgdI/YgdR family lipoprotein [Eubacterium sp.]|nr:YgdI/YgdR family lipoprotein [Eubacterium sp.]
MKKVLAIVLAAIMVMALAACSANTGKDGNKDNDSASTNITINVDMSKYPADFKDWTAQNVLDYFTEAVSFPSDCETWLQNHAEYWAGLPIYEVSGIWNDENAAESIVVMFTVFNPDSPDTTPEAVEEIQKIIREDKNHDYTTEDLFLGPQDHMIGHVAFSYGATTTDQKVYNEVEAAYNYLVEAMGVTPDF